MKGSCSEGILNERKKIFIQYLSVQGRLLAKSTFRGVWNLVYLIWPGPVQTWIFADIHLIWTLLSMQSINEGGLTGCPQHFPRKNPWLSLTKFVRFPWALKKTCIQKRRKKQLPSTPYSCPIKSSPFFRPFSKCDSYS